MCGVLLGLVVDFCYVFGYDLYLHREHIRLRDVLVLCEGRQRPVVKYSFSGPSDVHNHQAVPCRGDDIFSAEDDGLCDRQRFLFEKFAIVLPPVNILPESFFSGVFPSGRRAISFARRAAKLIRRAAKFGR